MDTIVVGIIAVVIGALLCFRGYVTMRLIISLFGAFVGFLLGAGLVAGITASPFGQLAISWLVGIVGAVIFGVLAYFSYQVAVIIGMAGIGFAIGTSLMAAFGVAPGFATIAVGVLAGGLLALLAITTNLPAVLLVLLTSLAGASITTSGVMILAGAVGVNQLTGEGMTDPTTTGWGWLALYAALAILGIVAQLRALSGHRRTMRQQWSAPMNAPHTAAR